MVTQSCTRVIGSAFSGPERSSKKERWDNIQRVNAQIRKVNEEIRALSKNLSEQSGKPVELFEVKELSFTNNRDGWLITNLESHVFVNTERLILNFIGYPPGSNEPKSYSIRHDLRPIGCLMVVGVTPDGEDSYVLMVKEHRFHISYLIENIRGWGETTKDLSTELLNRKLPNFRKVMVAGKEPTITKMGRSRWEDTSTRDGRATYCLVRIPLLPKEESESEDAYISRIQGLLRGKMGSRGRLERTPTIYKMEDILSKYVMSLSEERPEEETKNDQLSGNQTTTIIERYILYRMIVEKSLDPKMLG